MKSSSPILSRLLCVYAGLFVGVAPLVLLGLLAATDVTFGWLTLLFIIALALGTFSLSVYVFFRLPKSFTRICDSRHGSLFRSNRDEYHELEFLPRRVQSRHYDVATNHSVDCNYVVFRLVLFLLRTMSTRRCAVS